MQRPTIYDYLDYRSFLGDLFHHRKQQNKNFSYRYFSNKAGFASPNFLKLVIMGQRNLTNSSLAKVAKGFGLKKKERDFFENLVFMNQATAHDEKNYYYCKMIAIKGYSNIHKLEKQSFEYFSKWYYPVVREIIAFGPPVPSPEKIAALLNPRITTQEAEAALRLLHKLDLIESTDGDQWIVKDRDLTTGPEIRSLVVANLHTQMIQLAGEAIDRYRAKERDITALTLSIQRENLPAYKTRLAEFRRELLEMAGSDENPDQVIQINFQLFPLTK